MVIEKLNERWWWNWNLSSTRLWRRWVRVLFLLLFSIFHHDGRSRLREFFRLSEVIWLQLFKRGITVSSGKISILWITQLVDGRLGNLLKKELAPIHSKLENMLTTFNDDKKNFRFFFRTSTKISYLKSSNLMKNLHSGK